MRNRDKIVRVLLMIMIGLSLYLSGQIWTQSNSSSVDSFEKNVSPSIEGKNAKDVFQPTKLIYHQKDQKIFYTNRESLINDVEKLFLSYSLFNVSKESIENRKDYLSFLQQEDSVELVFANELSLPYYLEINEVANRMDIKEQPLFDRVVINYEEKKVYFVSPETLTMYSANYTNDNTELLTLLKDEKNRYVEVEAQGEIESIDFVYVDSVKLKKYSYILENQSYTMFSNALFTDVQDVFSKNASEESKDISFGSYDGQTLKITNETGEVSFVDPLMSNENEDTSLNKDIYSLTFEYLQKISNNLGIIRYFEGNETQVIYRNYVEGYPIFSEYSRGMVDISKSQSFIKMETNQNTIQVPIPSDEEVVLPKTADIVNLLLESGITSEEIEGLKIGYTWETSKETKQIVNLEPSWYVKYQGYWQTIDQVLTVLEEEKGEN